MAQSAGSTFYRRHAAAGWLHGMAQLGSRAVQGRLAAEAMSQLQAVPISTGKMRLPLPEGEHVSEKDPYLYEQFKESFREHCDRDDPEPTTYDWLRGLPGGLWRDAIDAARADSQSDASEKQ
jgi:hypothetical protein